MDELGENLTIAVVEAMPIVTMLLNYPEEFRGRDVIWFEDRKGKHRGKGDFAVLCRFLPSLSEVIVGKFPPFMNRLG